MKLTPRHIAIIMDGNGRWAQKRGRPRVFGHVRGSKRVKSIVREASRLGVQALTLYAFSTENWSRPESERQVLWRLLKKYLLRDVEELDQQNVRLRMIGEMDRLDPDIQEVLAAVIQRLSKNTGLLLTFALSYGSRREIMKAAEAFAHDCVLGKTKPESLNEDVFSKYLWTGDEPELGEVDLLIRTSGEQRMSNFLLWQSAYAEFYFIGKCWPDFLPQDLEEAVHAFTTRERRMGGVTRAEIIRAGQLSSEKSSFAREPA